MAVLMRIVTVIVIIIFCLSVALAENQSSISEISEAGKLVSRSANRFGLRLFQEVATDGEGNIFISPMSVSYALAMTLNGADGETRKSILSTLQLNGIDDINTSFKNLTAYLTGLDPLVIFDIANSIWYCDGLPINDAFVDVNRDNFDALVRGLDFSVPKAADIINQWVSDNTNEKIKKIVRPPIDPSTIMFLINAIYFKGDWTIKFDPNDTRDHPFYPAEGKETTCRMMFNTKKYDYFEIDLFQAISLPYGKADFAMTVFLPDSLSNVNNLIDRLDEQNWSIWQENFHKTKVELGLPHFKFEYKITLNEILKSMGMAVAFDGQKADFKKMLEPGSVPGQNIYIDQVLHKTFLQVDEEGTEAAAVTSVTMGLTSAMPMPNPVMIIDRPFLFAIIEKNSGSIVFIGKVTDPVWED